MKLTFRISGELISYNVEKRDYSEIEEEMIYNLTEDADKINQIIQDRIQYELPRLIEIKSPIYNVFTDIQYMKGSILTSGLVVLEVAGNLAGAISLVHMIAQAIQTIINRYLRENPGIYSSNIRVTPVSLPGEETSQADSVISLPMMRVLIGITAINIVFFLRGSLFNTIQIASVQDKYNEANRILSETICEVSKPITSFQRKPTSSEIQSSLKVTT